MKLRKYQNDTIKALRQSIANGNKRVIMCAPTGSGKTVMFSDIIKRASERGTITLVLTDRTELFNQTVRAVGLDAQQLNAGMKSSAFDPAATVTIGMVETYKRRTLENYEPKLIIVDEAHKGNFTKVFDKHPDALVIGATATPVGKHLFAYYNDIVSSIDIPELIDQGFLAPYRGYQMQDDFSDLKTARGEYTETSLFNHYNKRKLYDGVINEWKRHASDRKTIVFCVNIEHTIETHNTFQSHGVRSAFITSKTPKTQRAKVLEDFRAGKTQVLVNCGILTTGYDEPSIQCVIVNRKTKSLPLWLQMCGRGSRTYPGKDDFIVLDFGQNHDQHGRWDAPREWKLKPPKNKKGEAPVKECKKCLAINFTMATECHVCGNPFPKPEGDKLHKGVMVEVQPHTPQHLVGKRISDLTVDELILLQKSKRYKPTFIWRVLTNKFTYEVIEYGKKMGYSKQWIQYNTMKNPQPYRDYVLK